MPFGRPRLLQPDRSYCLLQQEGFISGYSHSLRMPLWSSFTVSKPVGLPENVKPELFTAAQLQVRSWRGNGMAENPF